MTTIDSQLLDSLGLTRAQEAPKANDQLGQTEFLKLMITQLNHQDPMKPMESGEFYTQIAQFSTVAGIQDLQGSFEQVASAMYSNQALQASAMVGRSVMVNASSAELTPEGTISGQIDLPASTARLTVGIHDQAGQLVRTLDLGDQPAGEVKFHWDGLTDDGETARPGDYRIAANMQFNGQSVGVDTQLASRVDSVSIGGNGQGITLNVAGIGAVPLASVKQVM